MDSEIHAASAAGLKYWAFVWYGADSSLRAGWDFYQSSKYKNLVNWCGIVTLDLLGSIPFPGGGWKTNIQQWFGYTRQPQYQKVSIDKQERPLIYILWDPNHLAKYFDNDIGNVKTAFQYFRELSDVAGVPHPYFVLLDSTAGAELLGQVGADAISNYIAGMQRENNGPYVDLSTQTQAYWRKLKDTGKAMVPIAMVGWDTRPRQERPVPWEHVAPNANPTQYFNIATPSEFATHLQSAVKFIDANPEACTSKLLLIYSWDECDEGGGLIPTRGDPSGSLLKAIAPVIG